MESNVIEAELLPSQMPLFASLPYGELKDLAATLRIVEVAPGTILFHEGDLGNHFYVVAAGRMEVIKALGTTEERLLGITGPGEFIGEMSLMNRAGVRTASVRAASQARLLKMTREDFETLLHRQPKLAYEMVRVLSARLADSQDAAICELQEKNRQLTRAYEELKAVQTQIIENVKMERELQVAHNIQMGLLPRQLPELTGYDLGALIMPMRAIGGDFYDFIPLSDNRLGIAIGDVSGHGVPAALLMALTVTLLRAEACRDCSPREVLRSVNRQLLGLNSEGMYVTLLYGVLNSTTGAFTYVRAGHEPPILWTMNRELIEPGVVPGQFLGVWDDPLLSEQTIELASANSLLLYTDGVTEATGGQAEMFGKARLKAAFGAHDHQPAQVVCEHLLEHVTTYTGGTAPEDDVTLVCVRAR
jgi:sigma-B regulation protein RsbU (phosphoserine phosphatase)